MTGVFAARRMLHIPPDLRGAARAICDVDPTQFPELYERPARPRTCDRSSSIATHHTGRQGLYGNQSTHRGVPVEGELQKLTTEVNDGVPLTQQEFRMFRVAYAECRQHLRGVPAALMGAGTPLSAVLSLTTRLDALCTELGITLTETFPQLKEVHTFALSLADSDDVGRSGGSAHVPWQSGAALPSPSAAATASADFQATLQRFEGGEQLVVQGVMLTFLAKILERAVESLLDYKDLQLERQDRESRDRHRRGYRPMPDPAMRRPNAEGKNYNSEPPGTTQRRLAGAGRVAANAPENRQPAFDGAVAARCGRGGGVSITSPLQPESPASAAAAAGALDGRTHESCSDNGEGDAVNGKCTGGGIGNRARGGKGGFPWTDPSACNATTSDSVGSSLLLLHEDDNCDQTADASDSSSPPRQRAGDGGASSMAQVADTISSVNADLSSHFAHLRWLVDITQGGGLAFFNADEHLDDISMRKMWSSFIGSGRPACTAEGFAASGFIGLFPAWLHEPMMAVLDYKQCGVVSIFSVKKLLKVWGPLLLLDRNLQDDIRSGVLCLREPSAYLAETLAMRPDAQVGDFAVALTETPGEIRLTVLRPATTASSRWGAAQEQQLQRRVSGPGRARQDSFPFSLSTIHVGITDSGVVPRAGRRRSRWMSTATFYCDQHLMPGNPRQLSSGRAAAPGTPVPNAFSTDPADAGADLFHTATRHNSSASFASSTAAAVAGTGDGGGLTLSVPGGAAALRSVSYNLSQETGAWTVQGLTREEFESIAEACRAFPDIFRRACGEQWPVPDNAVAATAEGVSGESGGGGGGGGTAVFASDARRRVSDGFARLQQQQQQQQLQAEGGAANSGLHRACFRNNTRYVRTLLTRGAGTVVNTAVTDPAVNRNFCWTPLLCAVNNPNSDPAEVVTLLLAAGANVEYSDDADCTALYYAIANGYAASVRLLLAHKPTLWTSPETAPLMVALGAHPYLPCERDIRRLTDVVPSAAMMESVSAYVDDYQLCSLAVRILLTKLNGDAGSDSENAEDMEAGYKSTEAPPPQRQSAPSVADVMRRVVMPHTPAGKDFEELHTVEEQAMLSRLIQYHDHLCVTYAYETRRALAVLCARCYFLSWREWLASPSSPSSTGEVGGEVCDESSVDTAASPSP